MKLSFASKFQRQLTILQKNFQRSFQESFKSDFIEAFKGTLLELLLNILTELVCKRTNCMIVVIVLIKAQEEVVKEVNEHIE